MPDEEYVTASKAATLSGLSGRQIRRLLETGVIQGIRPGHEWLVKPSAVMEYLRLERKPGRKRRDGSQGN